MKDRNDDELGELRTKLERLRERLEQVEDQLSYDGSERWWDADEESTCPTPGQQLSAGLRHAYPPATREQTEAWIADIADLVGVFEDVDLILDNRRGGHTVHLESGEVLCVSISQRTPGLQLQLLDVELWATMLELEEMG
jgi:hypothetical protein